MVCNNYNQEGIMIYLNRIVTVIGTIGAITCIILAFLEPDPVLWRLDMIISLIFAGIAVYLIDHE